MPDSELALQATKFITSIIEYVEPETDAEARCPSNPKP
jgi:hypothetical protein